MRARNLSLVLAFAVVLVAPTVAKLVRWDPLGSLDEKRALAERPKGPLFAPNLWTHVPAQAQAWEKYFGDHFGLRKLLVGSYRIITFELLRMSPHPAVVIGRSDGERRWLYFDAAVSGDGIGLASVRGLRPYPPAKLAAVLAQVRQVDALVRSRGATLVIAICPDKQTIYPEYLPAAQRPAPGAVSRLDEFWRAARRLAGVPILDLRPVLRQAKAQHQLYYPSDTHWNWRAGFLAYREIAKAIEAQDATRTLPPVEKIRWHAGAPRVGDLTVLMGVPPVGGDPDWQPDLSSRPAVEKRGKLLLIADSFFELVLPFLETQFAEVKKLYVTQLTRTTLTAALLDAEKPDVVILESVERYWTMD
jgi:alginate O-acetyltransferase complex protein AlgJ